MEKTDIKSLDYDELKDFFCQHRRKAVPGKAGLSVDA